jgi:hypothetical protein
MRAAIEVTPEDLADLKRRLRATRRRTSSTSLPGQSPLRDAEPSHQHNEKPLDLLLIGRIGGHRSQR